MNYLAGIFFLLLILVVGLFFPALFLLIIPIGIFAVLQFCWDALFAKDELTSIHEAERVNLMAMRREVAAGKLFAGTSVKTTLLREIDSFHPQAKTLISALGGDSSAQYSSGIMFSKGEGVPKDTEVGIALLKSAAAQGNVLAREWLQKKVPSSSSS